MASVAFHTDVSDKVQYTYRLARKAVRQGMRVCIAGGQADLALLDQALWTLEPQEFLPHGMLRPGSQPGAAMRRTPIWLTPQPEAWPPELPPAQVLVQVDPSLEIDPAAFERAIVVVGPDAQDKAAGRQRWRALQGLGHPVTHLPASTA